MLTARGARLGDPFEGFLKHARHMSISGTTTLTGLLGWPVSHSRSPAVHNRWFARHGINGVYVPLPVISERFDSAVRGAAAMGFRGVNVTVPHKEAAASVADRLDDAAAEIGAANTLIFDNGDILAANTDGLGFLRNLDENAPGWSNIAGPAVVLGAGGAARAVIWGLLRQGVTDIRVVNRSVERARALELQFERDLGVHGWGSVATAMKDATLLVNTTTLGMQGHPKLEISLDGVQESAVINDLVYAPLETNLLRDAKRHGLKTVDGLGMLLHQAAEAFHLWFGVQPAVDADLRESLAQK